MLTNAGESSPGQKKASLGSAIAAYTTALVLYQIWKTTRRRNRSRKNPKYLQRAPLRPVHKNLMTPWNQILSRGKDNDFFVSLNMTYLLFKDKLMPLFENERKRCNVESPYRTGPKFRRRNPFFARTMCLECIFGTLRRKVACIVCALFLVWCRVQ